MSKSLEEQLKFAHEQFDRYQRHAQHLDRVGKEHNICSQRLYTEYGIYVEMMDMWLSIINSLTLLMEENSQTLELEAAMARKELIYARAGIK